MKKQITIYKADIKAALWGIFMIIWTIIGACGVEASWYEETGFIWIIGGAVIYICNMIKVTFAPDHETKEEK